MSSITDAPFQGPISWRPQDMEQLPSNNYLYLNPAILLPRYKILKRCGQSQVFAKLVLIMSFRDRASLPNSTLVVQVIQSKTNKQIVAGKKWMSYLPRTSNIKFRLLKSIHSLPSDQISISVKVVFYTHTILDLCALNPVLDQIFRRKYEDYTWGYGQNPLDYPHS